MRGSANRGITLCKSLRCMVNVRGTNVLGGGGEPAGKCPAGKSPRTVLIIF